MNKESMKQIIIDWEKHFQISEFGEYDESVEKDIDNYLNNLE
ncbi:MAG: hypothetical protein ACOWWH_12655 [Eubacteriaceae bacterium]